MVNNRNSTEVRNVNHAACVALLMLVTAAASGQQLTKEEIEQEKAYQERAEKAKADSIRRRAG